ncbi:Uncharacterised protein [Mycobacteroides abscessus subsp. abscessus]|nr:Uncharacterised protein [Mycobacteroides abscessus subsp. abscessus]
MLATSGTPVRKVRVSRIRDHGTLGSSAPVSGRAFFVGPLAFAGPVAFAGM